MGSSSKLLKVFQVNLVTLGGGQFAVAAVELGVIMATADRLSLLRVIDGSVVVGLQLTL